MSRCLPHRFDREDHIYVAMDTGEELPHVTGMLEQTGWTDHTHCPDDAKVRGTAVHKLTADYDLGALELPACVSRYRNYLLAHAKAMAILKPEILTVEESLVHPDYRFGGTPDRTWRLFGLVAVAEVKSGDAERAHRVQTALQAILVSLEHENLPAEMIARYALYLKKDGKFVLEEHKDKRDFNDARRVIEQCCR